MPMTYVVLDTCVLLKARVSDVLMDLRAERLFFAHWTEGIAEEYLRNLPRLAGASEAQGARRLAAGMAEALSVEPVAQAQGTTARKKR